MKTTLFVPMVMSVLVSFCFVSEVSDKLDLAESLLQPRPDSCLAIMESIDVNNLRTREEKARYALLMSAALDKNYVEVTSDSLIQTAVDYYSVRNDQKRRMMAYYYQGLILNSAGDYTASIISLEKAEKDALAIEDHLYAGLIYRTKGDIFSKTMNNRASQACIQDAIAHFKYLENSDYVSFAELGLAISYINSHDFSTAKQQLESVLLYNNDILKDYYSIENAVIQVETDGDPLEAVRLFREAPKTLFDLHDYCFYALAMESIGQKDSTERLFNGAYALCLSQEDSVEVDFMYADVLYRRGYYKDAYNLTRKAAFVQDSLTRVFLQQSVSNAQRDYYKAESQLQEERAERLRERNRLGILVCLLALALLSGLTISYRKRKEQEVKEQMLELSIAKSELHQAEQTNASLLGSLFSEKLNHLDKISGNYVLADSDRERLAALREFKEEIASMRTDEDLFLSLEKDLDRYCDGVMTKLRSQVPSIKGENLKLIALFFAGLPYSTVQLVMNRVSIESLKMARSRFRKEIKAANASDEVLFLKLLEMKGNRSVHQRK
ncbi:MAG: hypothetical protein IKR72_02525 [Bacteroidales bacterium]|nr:hypothetical protein [Bacteroidales bacterium]